MTTTPNMNLNLPSVGATPGPDYATQVNNSLVLIDQHNHTSGNGVAIPASGLNITTPLTFNNTFVTNLAGATFSAQSSTPSNGTVYQNSNGFLYYVDLNTGSNIQITNSSGVAGSPGSISNLVSPASANYVSGSSTFVWQSNTSIAANLDAGSLILRNLSPNSTFGLTLQPPNSLSSNFTLTLPSIPGSDTLLGITSSGVITSNASSIVTGSNIANNTITGSNIASSTVARSNQVAVGQQISASCGTFTTGTGGLITNLSVTITTTGRPVIIMLQPVASSSLPGAIEAKVIASSPVNAEMSISIKRSATTIASFDMSLVIPSPASSVTYRLPGSLMYMDIPPGGTSTYTASVFLSGTTTIVTISNMVLVAYEL